jgi:hypothetical protein
MSFLDRFKSQPRWKHTDPAIRAAAVSEIPADAEHRTVIEELAARDDDARVRGAAIARVEDVATLARLAHSEQDHDVKRQITDRLVGIALAPAPTDADAALALDGLEDPKHFSTIAKSSPHDTVRAAALGRVHDTKALGSVARHAEDGRTALEAVGRLSDPVELLNVALKTDQKDAGIAALEKCVDPTSPDAHDTLESVSSRAKNKSVVKRARAMLQAIEDAEAARRAALESWQHRIAAVVARAEAIAAAPVVEGADERLSEVETDWREALAEGGFEMDGDTAARFGSLVETARTAIETHRRAEAERRAVIERDAALRQERTALCERLEQTRSEDALQALERARAEWEGMPASSIAGQEDEQLRARFEAACERAARRHEHLLERDRIQSRLATIAADADRISNAEASSPEEWDALHSEWADLVGKIDELDPALRELFGAAEARVRLRAEEKRATAERALKQQLQRVDQLIDRAHARAGAEDLTLREADRIVRELRNATEAPPTAPDQPALVERIRAAYAAIAPKLHELREMDEWKRFANAAVQEELIAKTEALRARYGFDAPEGPKPEDVEKAARELHEIQERWKQAAEAPRAQAQTLWHRYRQAADPIQARAREFFAHRVEERKANLDRKLAIIERAEALTHSTAWIKTAEELKTLQAEWQAIGPVPRQDTRTTWKRFREACDTFFTRRNADLAQRKELWAANQAKKEALCARAEELAASTEWDRAAGEIRRLQAEWKTVGPVRRNKSEALWNRFRAACDTFFDRYKRRDEIDLQTRQADREALVGELESLVPAATGELAEPAPAQESVVATPEASAPIEDTALLERVRSLRSRWNQSTPVVRHGADPLSGRFMAALERLLTTYPEAFRGTELDVEANRNKMTKLCERVEGFLTDVAAAPTTAQGLAERLREALAANTIGGRAGEETKWRAMAEDVRSAQAAWSRLGPVPGDAGRELADRFHKATNRFFDQYRRHMPQHEAPSRRGKPVGARS